MIPQLTQHDTAPRRRSAGLTLIEMMIAMGILVVSLVSLASIFPVATYLQKQASDDVLSMHTRHSIETMLLNQKIELSRFDSASFATPDGFVFRLDPNELSSHDTRPINGEDYFWTIRERCYPPIYDTDGDGRTNEVASKVVSGTQDFRGPHNEDPDGRGDPVQFVAEDPEDHDFDQRAIYWVPLGWKEGDKRRLYVFVMRSKHMAVYNHPHFPKADTANPEDDVDGADPGVNAGPNAITTHFHIPRVVRAPLDHMGNPARLSPSNANETIFTLAVTNGIGEPSGASTAANLRVGDTVLFDNGVVARVSQIQFNGWSGSHEISVAGDYRKTEVLDAMKLKEPTAIWFALPPQTKPSINQDPASFIPEPDGPNPTLRILVQDEQVLGTSDFSGGSPAPYPGGSGGI